MKRYIVEQNGQVQVDASRRFVIEVPDHITEEQAQDLLVSETVTLPEDDGMEWWDLADRKWVGYLVEIEETDVHDPETIWGTPSVEGLRVIRLNVESQGEE
jgi:hypothetical protein